MSYTTLQALTDRYGRRMLVALTDREGLATGELDVQVVARAIADAGAFVDGFLAVRYRLPLGDVPPLVSDLAARVAIWNLHTAGVDPKIEADYRDALKTLEGISKGLLRLDLDGVEPPGSGNGGARITDRDRPLTAANLKGYV